MARGTHHGGSTHTGGFHSSGGSRSSGGSNSSGHASSGGGSGEQLDAFGFEMIRLFVLGFGFMGITIAKQSSFSEIVRAILFGVAIILVVKAFLMPGDISEFESLLSKDAIQKSFDPIYSRYTHSNTSDTKTDGSSWYTENDYFISFFRYNVRSSNIEIARKFIMNLPFVLRIRRIVWVISVLFWIGSSLFFYDMVIPYFENSIMSDIAFKFIDFLVFFLPAILAILSGVAMLVIERLRRKMMYKCCVEIVNQNQSAKIIISEEEEIKEILKQKWYYNECKNCGAVDTKSSYCKTCGSSLNIMIPDNIPLNMRHQKL